MVVMKYRVGDYVDIGVGEIYQVEETNYDRDEGALYKLNNGEWFPQEGLELSPLFSKGDMVIHQSTGSVYEIGASYESALRDDDGEIRCIIRYSLIKNGEVSYDAVPENTLSYYDEINNPPHYNTGKYEAMDIIIDRVSDPGSYLEGSVYKYLYRYQHKQNPLKDLKKARYFLDELIREVGNRVAKDTESEFSEQGVKTPDL